MSFINITQVFGIVIRRSSLSEKRITLTQLFAAMETDHPLDQDDRLLSFGPHFGEEAAQVLSERLETLGLTFVDDYFVFTGDFPDWCRFGAAFR